MKIPWSGLPDYSQMVPDETLISRFIYMLLDIILLNFNILYAIKYSLCQNNKYMLWYMK